MDAREQAELTLHRAAQLYEQQANPDGLLQVASIWLSVWEREEFPEQEQRFGFRVQTEAQGEEIGESE